MKTEGAFQVKVEGIRFDAAHFATFGGHCEPLHGHSYEVSASVDGSLTEDSWVLDFIQLKAILRSLCDELDHRFLLQRDSTSLRLERLDQGWQISTPRGNLYTFPSRDVVALPLDNTTAERLAQWFCTKLWQAIETRDEKKEEKIEAVTVEVWEGPGQRASYRLGRLPQA